MTDLGKESAYAVDIDALTDPRYYGDSDAFTLPPRPLVADLLSALATSHRIAYFSDWGQEMFEVIDEWLTSNLLPDGVLYLAEIDDVREDDDEITEDLVDALRGRFDLRGIVRPAEYSDEIVVA